MAILDAKTRLATDQAVTATAPSENVIDLGAAIPDLGGGVNLFAVADITEAFATNTSIQVVLQHSTDNSTFTDLVEGEVVAVADAVVGKRLLMVNIPQFHNRYLRLNFVVVGTDATAGKINAYLTQAPQTA